MPSKRCSPMSLFRCFWAALALLLLLPLSVCAGPAAEWTLMVYMCGDNNLETAAIMDMLEMEQSIPEGVEVLVLLDRSKGYTQVAHMKEIGKKFGKWYDLLWYQKRLLL